VLATLQAACLALLATASAPAAKAPAAASFEGRLDYQLLEVRVDPLKNATKKAMVGSATFRLTGAGSRAEIALRVGPPESQMRVILRKKAQPDRLYVLNPLAQDYSVQDLNAKPEGLGVASSAADAKKPPQIVKLGRGEVAGYACDKIRVTWKKVTTDLCYSTALGKAPASFGMADYQIELSERLRAAGYDGIPLSFGGGDVQKWEMVLVSSNPQPVPATYLDVPAGYKETKPPVEVKPATEAKPAKASKP
jgi:hypothetical protein